MFNFTFLRSKLIDKKQAGWTMTMSILIIALVVITIFATSTGPSNISADKVVYITLSKSEDFVLGILNGTFHLSIQKSIQKTWSSGEENIVFFVRLPRVLLGLMVGASLAVAGVTTQGIFKNPMADPYILGVSSGAAFGAALVIVAGFTALNYTIGPQFLSIDVGSLAITIGAFIGAVLSSLLVFNIARKGVKVPVETLLLSGIAVSAFFSAVTSFLMYISGRSLNQIVYWVMGALWSSSWSDLVIVTPFTILGAMIIYAYARDLNVLLLGDETAVHLGTDVTRLKTVMLVLSSLIAASAVAVSGIIGFVGLIIPHMMRLIVGPDHRILLPSSMLVGAIFLTLADTFSRIIIQPTEIPVGIITALIGAPFFIYLLIKKKKETIQ